MTPLANLKALVEASELGQLVYQEKSDAYTHIIRGPGFFLQFSQDPTGKTEAQARLFATAVNLAKAITSEGAVERAARAMCLLNNGGVVDPWEQRNISAKSRYLAQARCALNALLEGLTP